MSKQWPTWSFSESDEVRNSESGLDVRLHASKDHDVRNSSSTHGNGRNLLMRFLGLLSLLRYLLPRRGRPQRTRELDDLAYLAALRGILSLMVFHMHFIPTSWHPWAQFLYDCPWTSAFLRGGPIGTNSFFWISGYVLSYRAFGFIHSNQPVQLLDTVASTLFRRWLRLFLPLLPFTLIITVGTHAGVMTNDPSLAVDAKSAMKVAYFPENWYWYWFQDSLRLINPFADIRGYHNGAFGSRIINPTWALATEFRSTIYASAFLVATYRMRHRQRAVLIWSLVPMFWFYEANWAAMAFIGMWFADRRQYQALEQKTRRDSLPTTTEAQSVEKKRSSETPNDRPIEKQEAIRSQSPVKAAPSTWTGPGVASLVSNRKQVALYALFLYSFLIFYYGTNNWNSTWFPNPILTRLEGYWWHGAVKIDLHLCCGILALVYPLDRLPQLQRPLRTPFAQYLGELSFGIFATHMIVKGLFWWPILTYYDDHKMNIREDSHRLIPLFLLMFVPLLWFADMFRKLDFQVIRLCKWLEKTLWV